MASAVDCEKAERKVWIVKVPPYVAKQWHEAIARAGQAADEDVMHTEVLGQVTIDNGMATTLQVPGAAGSNGLRVLHMNPSRDAVETAVFSYDPGAPQPAAKSKAAAAAAGPIVQAPKVEGVVHKRYDAAPVRIADVSQADLGAVGVSGLTPEQIKHEAEQRQRAAAALQAQVDAAYLQNSRKRLAAATARPAAKRTLQVLTDIQEVRQLAGGGDHNPVYAKQRDAKVSTQLEAKSKRVRMARDELEQELFKKFGEQPHWHFMQLQKELDQPVTYLKEVLNEMAVQVKRGPNKDLWELKKHLITSTAPQQRQQQQQAPPT